MASRCLSNGRGCGRGAPAGPGSRMGRPAPHPGLFPGGGARRYRGPVPPGGLRADRLRPGGCRAWPGIGSQGGPSAPPRSRARSDGFGQGVARRRKPHSAPSVLSRTLAAPCPGRAVGGSSPAPEPGATRGRPEVRGSPSGGAGSPCGAVRGPGGAEGPGTGSPGRAEPCRAAPGRGGAAVGAGRGGRAAAVLAWPQMSH